MRAGWSDWTPAAAATRCSTGARWHRRAGAPAPAACARWPAPPASAAPPWRPGTAPPWWPPRSRTPDRATCRAPGAAPGHPRAGAPNRPSSSHSLASTSTAARKATTGQQPVDLGARRRAARSPRPRPGRPPRARGHRLRPALRAGDREDQHHGQQRQRQDQCESSSPRVLAPPHRRQVQRDAVLPRPARPARASTRPGRRPHKARRATALTTAGRSRPSGCTITVRAPTARTVSVQYSTM